MSERQFVKLPDDLLDSRILPRLRVNTWRLLTFLMREHLHHGGKENGLLQAPREQLEAYGIGSHYISDAIHQAEQLGLLDGERGIGKRSSLYTLTWLPLHDGSPPSHRRRSVMTAVSTSNDCHPAAISSVAAAEQQSLRAKSRSAKQQYLSRVSIPGRNLGSVEEGNSQGGTPGIGGAPRWSRPRPAQARQTHPW